MIEAEWWEHDDASALATAVAEDIGFIVQSALDARGSSLIALSGGKTPVKAYEALAAMKLDWARVTIIPTDDRVVEMSDPLSNVAMLAKIFLPRKARVIPLVAGGGDYRQAGIAADERMQALKWPPDLVCLGVGADGHTASIFVGPDLDKALGAPKTQRAVGVMPDPMPEDAPVARVTLTRSALIQARSMMLVLGGDAKRAVVEEAVEEGADSSYPIGRLLADYEQPIDVHWMPA